MNMQHTANRATRGNAPAHSARVKNRCGRDGQMPYSSTADLPASVRDHLPAHAQEMYKEAFNGAYDKYAGRGADGREETAHKVAWAAVKKKYRKDEASGKWREV